MLDVNLSLLQRGRFRRSGVVLSVAGGAVALVTGDNASGKTTLLDTISGFCPAFGRIAVDGIDITCLAPASRHRRLLARTFQTQYITLTISDCEELMLRLSLPTSPNTERLMTFIHRFDAARRVCELSVGEQRFLLSLLALSRDARVILLDEPFAGLAPDLATKLVSALNDSVDSGQTLLIVEHPHEWFPEFLKLNVACRAAL